MNIVNVAPFHSVSVVGVSPFADRTTNLHTDILDGLTVAQHAIEFALYIYYVPYYVPEGT